MKHSLIYLRVSTNDQANQGTEPDGFSIPAQRRACLKKAEQLDADVTAEFMDRGESARTAKRSGLQALLNHLATNQVDYVIVHKVDRLARNLHDDVTIRLAIRQSGAQLISVSENVDNTPSGQLLHGVLASINEFYSGNLAAEALKGATEKARQGGTPYRVGLGYRNVIRRYEDRELRTVELDDERAPFIRLAFSLYATGTYTVRSLRDELVARGLQPRRTGLHLRPLSVSVLAKVLGSRYYLGFVNYNGHEYRGQHPPLVTPGTFAAVQLARISHRHGEKRQAHQHPLKGRIFCARCGDYLSYSISKGNYPYFFCLTRHGRIGSCDLPYLPVAQVEAAVVERYRRFELSTGQRNHLVSTLKRELTQAGLHLQEQRQAQAARRERLDREQTRLLQAYYEHVVTGPLMKTEQCRIQKEMTSIEQAEAELDTGVGERRVVEQRALELARSLNLSEAYDQALDQVKRFLTRACFSRLEFDDQGTLKPFHHGRHHDVQVVRAKLHRSLDYQQIVYALLLLADQAGVGEPAEV